MAQRNVKTRTGNRIIARFDGQIVGLLQNVRASDDYGPEPASGIGDIHVQEYVPTMARHSISVSRMVLISSSMARAGISTLNGDDALEGRVFDFEVLDKDTSEVLRKYSGCSFASGDVEVNKHQIVVSNAQFNALDVTGDSI